MPDPFKRRHPFAALVLIALLAAAPAVQAESSPDPIAEANLRNLEDALEVALIRGDCATARLLWTQIRQQREWLRSMQRLQDAVRDSLDRDRRDSDRAGRD